MEDEAARVAELLKLLANQHRLLALCAVVDGPKTVGDIAEHVPGISLPAISQHLSALRRAGILTAEKQGQHVIYSLADERITALLTVLQQQFCS